MAGPTRPTRLELFTFYFLGFNPEGKYRFPNVHQVAAYYGTSSDAIQRWLEEMDLSPGEILRRDCGFAALQADLQIEAPSMEPEEVLERATEILAEVDKARPTRKPWEDKPF
ncbi:MAG: hypothetical protein JJU11_03240 [Candidatus Sumerlaeia bacterium]|nr:hypothetical protein [Candidatus Sumerlaeia bacterium]